MSEKTENPATPETPAKKRVRLSIPRTALTHVASFLAGAATYAGVKKLSETPVDANLQVGETTVIDV